MGTMDEIAVVLSRFGDEQSTLFDQFERHSFEVRLNQAMLGRSFSEPSRAHSSQPPPVPPALVKQVRQGRRGSAFRKVLKKLLKPILGRKRGRRVEVPDPKNPMSWKAFSRSLRV